MKCSFCGMPVIINDNLEEKLTEALDDVVSDEDSVEFFIFKANDNKFLQLCVKTLSALKKRFPQKVITITAVIKNGGVLGDFWFEEDMTGKKKLIADAIACPENICGADTDEKIWKWIFSQCRIIFKYSYEKLEWEDEELIKNITKDMNAEIRPIAFPVTEFSVITKRRQNP